MDHVRELQGRLFAVAIVFVVLSAAAYPFFDKIVGFIVAPLGKGQELVYLTPGGAFSFIIQVCMYVGFIAALPVVIYNLYRFIMPAMKKSTIKTALFYTGASVVLALLGILFAYFVSLPAALYFLTGFDLYHINPMLTVDSYFSFIMTYMLVGALLFQIPLILLIINGVTPLQPRQLMRQQGKIILGSFIVAAIVSPTPDALNQTLLASPIIVMYQVGIVLVWLKNRRALTRQSEPVRTLRSEMPVQSQPVVRRVSGTPARPAAPVRSIDGVLASGRVRPVAPHTKQGTTAHGHVAASVDGFFVSA